MSTTVPSTRSAVERSRPAPVTPVVLDAAALESTAPDYLREVADELRKRDRVAVGLRVEASFNEAASLAVQAEADRVRTYVRAASYLGVDTVTVTVDAVADEELVRPTIEACAERARRDGLAFDVDGPAALEP
ncbi:hypothetical protein ACFQH6_10065 [Halobacteriaceae archaeon GCM10025711]